MKSSHEVVSVEDLCRLLRRSRLLTTEEVEALVRRWHGEAREAGTLGEFGRWLVAGHFVTDYQLGRLLRGRDDNYFLAGYKLLDQLHKGKHTVVYKGVDLVGGLAALKVLPASQARDPHALARFLRQARLVRDLSHVNVVRILASGEDRGAHFLVMEYLEGETLQKRLARGPLPAREAADLAVQVLAGLVYLHERGLVHGHLEPANVLLVGPPGGTGPPLVKLLDFSHARATGQQDPPETGEAGAADGQADLDGLGRVLYHALAGQPSPGGGTAQALKEANPEIPDELAEIVGRLMARDPGQGFAGAGEAAEAVKAFLGREDAREKGESVNVEPVGLPTVDWLTDHARAAPPPLPAEPKEEPGFAPSLFDVSPGPIPEPVVTVSPRRPQPRGKRGLELDRRDWLMLLAGAVGLLAAQALAWLVARLVSTGRDGRPRTEEK